MAAGSAAGQVPAASHPGNDYYVQPSTGTIQRQSNPIAGGLLQAAGFQGPMTWDQAQTVLQLNKKAEQQGKIPVTGTAGEAARGDAGSLPNPLAALGALEAFFRVLTDGKLWRSLGWIILGIILIMAGIYLWIAPAAGRTAAQVAPVAAALLCPPRSPCPAGT